MNNDIILPDAVRMRIDAAVKRKFAHKKGKQAELIREIEKHLKCKVHQPDFSKALAGDKKMPIRYLRSMELLLGLEPFELTDYLQIVQRGASRTFYGVHKPQELKNVVATPQLGKALLELHEDGQRGASTKRLQVPSLLFCVINSRMYVPGDVDEKINGPFRIFFQPSAIIRISWPSLIGKWVLASVRKSEERDPKQNLIQGCSVVWGASYTFNYTNYAAAMDNWVASVMQGIPCAFESFGNTLLVLLRYKLEFPGQVSTCNPLGVVTKLDVEKNVAYVSYVFNLEIELFEAPADLQCFSRDGTKLKVLPAQAHPERECISKGKRLHMDIVAWKAMNDANSLIVNDGPACFRRGFSICHESDRVA